MIELLLGAAAASWLVGKVLAGEEARRRNFPFVPNEWWTPRDKLFRVKEQAYVRLSQGARLNELYREYHRAHPDHTFGMLTYALATANEGRWEQSLELAEAMVRAEPKISVGYWRRAVAAENLGRKELAAESLEKFIELEPDSKLVPHCESWLIRLGHSLKKPEPKKHAKAAKAKKPAKAKPAKVAKAPEPKDDRRARLEQLKARARKVRSEL